MSEKPANPVADLSFVIAAWRERAKLGHQRAIDMMDACALLESYDLALTQAQSHIRQAAIALQLAGMAR